MDAHALLVSQGWRGTGHSLHPTSDKTGLSRPILVSQKQNNLGVGKKQHKTSDLWWMNAFDKSLQGLDTSKDGVVVQTVTNGGLDMVAKGGARFVGKGGGLYASFVSGGCLSGTLLPEDKGVEVVAEKPVVKKRKRDEVEETKEERRARRAAKRELKAQKSAGKEDNCAVSDDNGAKAESKEERKERRRLKKLRKTVKESAEDTPSNEDDKSVKVETKEERKERRRQKKLLQATEEIPVDASEKAKKKKRRKE